jgi:hypothetical protein
LLCAIFPKNFVENILKRHKKKLEKHIEMAYNNIIGVLGANL